MLCRGNISYKLVSAMVNTVPCAPYGLENFVTCSVQASSAKVQKYCNSLWVITGQNMHIFNCDFSIGNNRNRHIARIH